MNPVQVEPEPEPFEVTATEVPAAEVPTTDVPTDETAPPPTKRRRRWLKITIWTVSVIVVLALTLSLVVVWQVRRSWTDYGGSLKVAGLSAPVTVYRDAYGIPQVYADTADDLFRAQGYIHAQERFWEMDFRRHVTAGRLSELFGKDQVETDAYLRTMGWRRVAEEEWAQAGTDTRRYLQAYADGVNAWLKANGDGAASARVSLEYGVLGLQNRDYAIEPWSPIDSIAWLKAMAWDLRGNMESEITRAELLAGGLSRTQIEELYPTYPYDTQQPIVQSGDVVDGAFDVNAPGKTAASEPGVSTNAVAAVAPALAEIRRALRSMPAMVGQNFPGIGSNSWVISGQHTASGKPILANDPHLSPSMPGIWFQMGLHCRCDFNVEGFSFSGVPGVVIGHNDQIAWGFTNLDPDVTDLYLERLNADKAMVDGLWQPLTIRTETIEVAGGDPVVLKIRSTKHGPLLSDASEQLRKIGANPDVDPSGAPVETAADTPADSFGGADNATGYGISLAWTALSPGTTTEALFAVDTSRNWTDFRAAARLFEVPAQNMVYADVDGNIGYQSPGRVPIRTKGDGRWPAPGWDSAYDWHGYVPFEELPSVFNPTEGFVATANQAVIGPQYSHFLTRDWTYGYRSQRIRDLITSGGTKITLDDVQRMQFDNHNGMAEVLAPALLQIQATGLDARAQALLSGWDYQQPADGKPGSAAAKSSAAAAFYNAVWRNLLRITFDELPADDKPDGADRWFAVVTNLLKQPSDVYWDVKSTPATETATDVLSRAIHDAAKELADKYGDNPTSWRWGKLHTLTLENQTFGKSGIGPIEWLFNRGPTGVSGGDAIVNATGWTASDGYQVDAVPSMRMVVDLSNLDQCRWIMLTGESGHAFSPHYNDQFDLWRTGKLISMPWDRQTISKAAKHTQTLEP